jgi:phenylacetate-CoA ligase
MSRIRRLFNTAYVVARGRVERTVPFWPRERIERLQRYRLRGIIRHAYETVPFYRQAMDERALRPNDFRTVEDLSKLPLIDGMTVRRNVEGFLSTRYGDRSRHAVYTSGSTTGVRRLIYWGNTSLLHQLAHHERNRSVLSDLLGRGTALRRMNIVWPTSVGVELRAFWEASTLLFRSPAEDQIVSPEEPFVLVADRIDAVRPHVVFSYGSHTERFFRFLADSQMSIAVPRVWIYSADMLSPAGAQLIEKDFDCRLYSTYQTTETGPLGFQCEQRQGFHLNIDLCAVRLVDGDGQTAEPGDSGDVIVSNLYNRAMVLLNYSLGDRAVLATEPCPCGRTLPLLERLEGRSSEDIYLADGRTISPLMLEILCHEELTPTLQAQIVQRAPGQVLWRIVPFSDVDRDSLRRSLLERCSTVLGEDTLVEVEFVDAIPTPERGKFPRLVSHVEAPDARPHDAGGHLSG